MRTNALISLKCGKIGPIHSFIHFNLGSKAHKTTDKNNVIKAHINIKTQKDRQMRNRTIK